eukprot:423885-Rhodomonas_salina.1
MAGKHSEAIGYGILLRSLTYSPSTRKSEQEKGRVSQRKEERVSKRKGELVKGRVSERKEE